ncbi:CCA tRNA nucleotidyltransferase [Candidatus Nitrososphaera sp. FF02]|uniref:CCA tRNA nucleotidyltransferase n=1 Tax=Candidatus Nitrososphaera sp. FF02 TaxID=3398226 RepID=UPI0039E72F34
MIQGILAKALLQCSPAPAEARRIAGIAEEARRLVEQAGTPEVRQVVFGGSFAKGTWLKGDADIDIFVKIDPAVDEQSFEKIGVQIGKSALAKFRPKLRYSDHPYVEAVVKGVKINVVPCYDVQKGQWKSAADRSPFHTQYITEVLDDAKKGQVRLLKKFLKSAGIYGAEISTGGFSGYVSEVLIAKYGSLESVLAAAAALTQGQVIAVGEYDPDVVKGFASPLVIIDPIDPRRNLGTAVSPESAGKFSLAARAFLRRPSARSFERQQPKVEKKLYGNILVVEFSHRERSPDTIWGQLKRSSNSLAKQLEIAGFTVFRWTCATDEKKSGAFAFLLESLALPRYAMRKGPEIARTKDTDSFVAAARPLAMWADREMRVSTVSVRKETDAGELIKALLKKPEASGVARDMMAGKLKIYSGSGHRLSGLVKKAVDELASTESFFR